MMRVVPGDTGSSYLWHKLTGTHTKVGGSGGQMPLGYPALDAKTLGVIETWILEGAPEYQRD